VQSGSASPTGSAPNFEGALTVFVIAWAVSPFSWKGSTQMSNDSASNAPAQKARAQGPVSKRQAKNPNRRTGLLKRLLNP
jgi:hypothetical protein